MKSQEELEEKRRQRLHRQQMVRSMIRDKDKKAGVTRTQIKQAITRMGKHLRVSGPVWRWDVPTGLGTESDPYPFRDLSIESDKRGDWDGGWGGLFAERKDMYKRVEMGRGADIYCYRKTGFCRYSNEWEYELRGTFYFCLPYYADGQISIRPILDHYPNGHTSIPFMEMRTA